MKPRSCFPLPGVCLAAALGLAAAGLAQQGGGGRGAEPVVRVDTEMFAPAAPARRRHEPVVQVDTEMFAPPARTRRRPEPLVQVDTEMFAPAARPRRRPEPTVQVDTEMFAPAARTRRRLEPLVQVDTEMFAPTPPGRRRSEPIVQVDTEMFAPAIDLMAAPELPADPEFPDLLGDLPMLTDGTIDPRDMMEADEGLPPSPPAEVPPPDTPAWRLQLALDAMQPVLPSLAPAPPSLASSIRVAVKRFVFKGNRVFSSRQLAKTVAPWANRTITPEDLEEARLAVTKQYVEAGYVTSGAVLPDQDVQDGVVHLQVVEGRLTDIELRGNWWFRGWWIRNELRRAAGRPLNFLKLKQGIQLLRQNPTISRINAEVKPGAQPGESHLEIAVKDEQPFRFGFELSNKRPPSVSEGLGEIYLTHVNLTGHDDPLDLRWGLVRWTKDGEINGSEFENVSGRYEFPITPWGTTFGIHAARSDASIIDETFAELNLTSRYEEIGVEVRQPLWRTLRDTVTATLSADRKHSETFLLGQPFTLGLGAIDGETDTFATRLAFDWVSRSQLHVLAVRSVFSLGLYEFEATRDDPGNVSSLSGGDALRGFEPELPDSKFFAWLGQAQFVGRLFDTAALRKKPETLGWNLLRETLLVLRANVQLADEPLLSLEQFSIGGVQSVRGYRENQLLRDNGLFASAELRIPLWLAKDKTPIIALAPFFDFGGGWNVNKVDDNYQTIYSAGIGIVANPSKHAKIALYWGHPFVDFNEQKESIQDYGIHFSVAISAF